MPVRSAAPQTKRPLLGLPTLNLPGSQLLDSISSLKIKESKFTQKEADLLAACESGDLDAVKVLVVTFA
jgi:hypothetical protein